MAVNSSTNETQVYTHRHFDLIVGIWLPGLLCILGSLGNGISLYVLSRYKGHNVTFYSLRALASSDIVLLVSALVQQVIPMVCVHQESNCTFCLSMGYIRVYAWPVVCMAQMCSIWLTILISTERYQAICQPLHSKSTRTISLIRRAVLCISVISVLFNVPKFFEFYPEAVTTNNVTMITVGATRLRSNLIYRFFYNTALHCLIIYALPIVILLYLNGMIVYKLRMAMQSLQHLSRKQQSEYRATTVPLCIVVVFIICDTQALISFILDAIYVDSHGSWVQYYTAISNLLVIFNSAVNFVIFYMFGTKFRKLLWHYIACYRKQHVENSVNSTSFNKRCGTSVYTDSTVMYSRVNLAIETSSTIMTTAILVTKCK